MIITTIAIMASMTISSIAYSATLLVIASDKKCSHNSASSGTATSNGYCTIQSAINDASDKDIIKIPAGIYVETLDISKSVTLVGDTSSPSIIDAQKKGSVIQIQPGNKVTIKNLTIVNGYAQTGGGIHNQGSLMLVNSEIKNNTAFQSGGGIYNAGSISGSLYISNSKIINNKAQGDDKFNVKYGGGGIYNNSPLNISNSTISNNMSVDNGAGIYSIYAGRKAPSDSQLIAEQIGLATAPTRRSTLNRKSDIGSVLLHKTVISHNIAGSGGGINLQGVMTVKKSLIHNNKAINHKRSAGGGIFSHLDSILHISNTSISKNEAKFRGAGIRFYSTKTGTLDNVSIIHNNLTTKFGQGAGLYLEKHTRFFSIQNSVIAENTIAHVTPSDCAGNIQSAGYNFIGSIKRCSWLKESGDIISDTKKIDPGLYFKADEDRYYISKNSPLINNGSPAGCLDHTKKILKKDQLGNSRTIDRCDIGAIEHKN